MTSCETCARWRWLAKPSSNFGFCRARVVERTARPFWYPDVTDFEWLLTHRTHGADCAAYVGAKG